jgi:hypothetical protein
MTVTGVCTRSEGKRTRQAAEPRNENVLFEHICNCACRVVTTITVVFKIWARQHEPEFDKKNKLHIQNVFFS